LTVRAALCARVSDELHHALDARGVGVYEPDTGGQYRLIEQRGSLAFPTVINADDAAFVRMRTDLYDVDLNDVKSRLGPDGLALPLTAQGQVQGALVCGIRLSEEPYDPDERAMLRTFARRLSVVLTALRAKECTQLVRDLATGAIDPQTAKQRAAAINP